jgi:hypothetical protein
MAGFMEFFSLDDWDSVPAGGVLLAGGHSVRIALGTPYRRTGRAEASECRIALSEKSYVPAA